jgi:hypothetical protein
VEKFMNDLKGVIGWYVHHQGLGHVMRFIAVAERMQELAPDVELVGLGSEPPKQWKGPWINLPRDDIPYPNEADERAGGALHWAPLMHRGMRQRSAITADWLARSNCQLFVADVSVEMLVLARLCSVPTVAVAMRGRRDDRPHALGYDVSRAILAPWPVETQESLPDHWKDKLVAVGSFSRFDSLIDDTPAMPGGSDSQNVLLLLGHGGHAVPFDKLVEAAVATQKWHWYVVGVSVQESEIESQGNLTLLGRIADVWPILRNADVVVGPCGAGTVSEVAAARKPFIALPQARPFDEQVTQARILQKYGLADVAWSWPDAASWPVLLESAASRDQDRWRWYHDGKGSTRACEALLALAAIPR